MAKNSSLTQLSCPPSPIISLMKALLIFVCIYWIDVESISTPWEFSNEHRMMMSSSVSFPVEWECSTICKHIGEVLIIYKSIDMCWWDVLGLQHVEKLDIWKIVISTCWEFLLFPITWLMSFIWSIAWGQASLSMGYFDVLVFSMILVFISCLLLLHLG